MRLFAVVPVLSILLTAAPTFAQAPSPAQTPPTAKQPDPPPAGAVAPQPPAAAPVPFRDGAKYGWVNIQVVAAQSQVGKNAAAKITALRDSKQKELTDKQKAVQALQQKLETEGSLRSEASRASMQTDIERQQRELQRLAEDADNDIERLTQQLQQEFLTLLQPAIPRVAKQRSVDFIFSAESLLHGANDLNLTEDLIKAVDESLAAKPAPAAPATTTKPAPTTPAK
jgi:Skp family chaperone for outer membrane proteins